MHLEAGTSVLYQGYPMEVRDASNAEAIILIDPNQSGVLYQCTLAEVTQLTSRPIPLAPKKAAEWEERDRIVRTAREILATQNGSERAKLYEESSKKLGCSVRTLQRKVAKFSVHKNDIAFNPAKSGRRTGIRMLAPKVEEIIATCLDQIWLKKNQPNLSDVISHIHKECRKFQLAEPSATTIRKRVRAISEYERIRRRKGAKAAKYRLDPMVGQIKVAKLLEMVQIDHTLADFQLVSELDLSVVVGRPWVTLAIDVASRMIVGVYISLESPSAVSVGMCIINAILPKSDFLEALGLSRDWPAHGIMILIHTDNGREFHSEALKHGCSVLNIDMQQRPVGSPHYGAIIERVIGNFMGKCRLLPGSTHRNVTERGDYDAEGKAFMTLPQFTAFFVNEILVYNATKHRSLGVPPLTKWKDLQKEGKSVVQPLPLGIERWQLPVLFYPFAMRKIRRTGIELHTRLYWADELAEWVGSEEPRAIHFHPGDASKVYLQGPSGGLVVARHTGGDERCISFEELRMERREIAKRNLCPEQIAQKDAGLEVRETFFEQAKSSRKKKIHRAATIQKTREALTRNVPNVNTTPSPTAPTEDQAFKRRFVDMNISWRRA